MKKKISKLEKELYENQLDFHYLSSPKILQEKISFLTTDKYQYMNYSKIYFDLKSFIADHKKITKK